MSQREPLPTDLTDAQWEAIERFMPQPKPGGRRREIDLREVVNAIRFQQVSGCQWRLLPATFPNPSTVRYYHDLFKNQGLWEEVERALSKSKQSSHFNESSNSPTNND
ncbi:transposase [Pirellulaceae bacterium SH449]